MKFKVGDIVNVRGGGHGYFQVIKQITDKNGNQRLDVVSITGANKGIEYTRHDSRIFRLIVNHKINRHPLTKIFI